MMKKNEVGERVKMLLAHNNKQQKELAHSIGVKESAMSYYLSGHRRINLDVLVKMAKYLHVTTDYLLLGDDKNED